MRPALSLLGMLLLRSAIAQQPPTVEWMDCFGGTIADVGYAVVQTTDSNYVAVGKTLSMNDGDVSGNHGGTDVWAIKLDASGALLWQHCIGGSAADEAYAVVATPDDGVLLAGLTESFDGDALACTSGPLWVVKLDAAGDIQWQNCFAATTAYSIDLTSDGGCFVVGGSMDLFVAKLDPLGALVWLHTYGSSGVDVGYSGVQTDDGGYIVTGSCGANNGDVTGWHGSLDCWVLKLDAAGDIEWQDSYGGTGFDRTFAILQTSDGGYLAGGVTGSSDGDVGPLCSDAAWMFKLDAAGALQWQQCYEPGILPNSGGCVGTLLAMDDGAFVAAGIGDGEYWLQKIDITGAVQWQQVYGLSGGYLRNAAGRTLDGGFICTDGTGITGCGGSNNGGSDMRVFKLEKVNVTEGIEAVHTPTLSIFPDPGHDLVRVTTTQPLQHATLSLRDALGREVQRLPMPGTELVLDLGAQARGPYILTLHTEQALVSKHFVVE